MKYAKKFIVEAVIFNGYDKPYFSEMPTWLEDEIGSKLRFYDKKFGYLGIETIEGKIYIKPGDYIIRGARGELYGCDAEIFKETYEKVEG